ncbi:MAG: hypothetical protein OEY79_02490 [Anaplasmataceae bacterium]|nr:hypothetical protein [Anaplasmataceae bacterium]
MTTLNSMESSSLHIESLKLIDQKNDNNNKEELLYDLLNTISRNVTEKFKILCGDDTFIEYKDIERNIDISTIKNDINNVFFADNEQLFFLNISYIAYDYLIFDSINSYNDHKIEQEEKILNNFTNIEKNILNLFINDIGDGICNAFNISFNRFEQIKNTDRLDNLIKDIDSLIKINFKSWRGDIFYILINNNKIDSIIESDNMKSIGNKDDDQYDYDQVLSTLNASIKSRLLYSINEINEMKEGDTIKLNDANEINIKINNNLFCKGNLGYIDNSNYLGVELLIEDK